jgi:hypothetical protein
MQSQFVLSSSSSPSLNSNALAAKERCLKLMTQLEKAFKEGAYGTTDKPFEQALYELLRLLKPRLGGLTLAERMDNPTHLVIRLLSLMNEDAFLNLSQDNLRYQIAAALHAALDLVVIESYEESWISFPKNIHTPYRGEIEAIKIIEFFERGKFSLALQYELDCCKENIRALLEKKKDWEKVLDIIKLGIARDTGGLLQYINELRQEFQPLWQVTVLLFRRLVPLAQQSLRVLTVLQSMIADTCQGNEFHCHYAAQEALAETIALSQGKERIAIQRQALGERTTGDKIKAVRERPTYWYLAQIRPPEHKAILGVSRKQENDCRYRLIHSLGDLLVEAIESKEAWSEDILNNLIEMLFYLQETEPAYLKEAQTWVRALNEKIRQDKPKAFYFEAFEQAHPGLEKKHLIEERECLKTELQYTVFDLKKQQIELKKVYAEKTELENTYQIVLAQQAEMKKQEAFLLKDKAKWEEEKAALIQHTLTDRQHVVSLERQCNRMKKQLEAAEATQKDLLEELDELKQAPQPQAMQARIQTLNDELKEEQTKVAKLNVSIQNLNEDLSVKSEQLRKLEETLSKDREALTVRKAELDRAEQTMTTEKESLKAEQEKLDQRVHHLKTCEERLKQQQIALEERESSLTEREYAMALQIEEIPAGSKKSVISNPSSSPSKSLFIIKPWRKEPFDPDFCKIAEAVKMDAGFLCPVLQRPAYDAMTLILATQEENSEGHLISDEAARHLFLEKKETTCPCCRQEVTGIMINRPLRALIKSIIETAALSKDPALLHPDKSSLVLGDVKVMPLLDAKETVLPSAPINPSIVGLFKPIIRELKLSLDPKQVTQVLTYVTESQQSEAETLLKKEPYLALTYGTVTDPGERTFKRITAFQYAVWALDWHMWEMMLKHFKDEHFALAAEQYKELNEQGTEHEKTFSLVPLVEALKAFPGDRFIYPLADTPYDTIRKDKKKLEDWRDVVGGLQKRLPLHVINEYCRTDRSFDPTPTFEEKELPREKAGRYDWIHWNRKKEPDGETYKFTLGGRGGDWIWIRASYREIYPYTNLEQFQKWTQDSAYDLIVFIDRYFEKDSIALMALNNKRTQQKNELGQLLEKRFENRSVFKPR